MKNDPLPATPVQAHQGIASGLALSASAARVGRKLREGVPTNEEKMIRLTDPTEGRSSIRMAKGERGIWQRRFWEHAIRDQGDYARHTDYVHFNPAKHGYVSVVAHWPHSTFHRWVKAGAYPPDWGARVRWMLLPASVDDNVVTCHSAEHPCGASALTRATAL